MFANEDNIKNLSNDFDSEIIDLARDISSYFKYPPNIFSFSSNDLQIETENQYVFIQVLINTKKEIELMCLAKANSNSPFIGKSKSFVINNQVYNNEYICRRIQELTSI